ncbi:MAG: exodeoxyribonuclease V subunit gamma [Chloroflexi bacterium]|nr:exodeoxyribonuclease V subunit gamma [Chloroflexota bacterium]
MELWRSEPGGGKTHAVIELVQQVASQHPLQRIWVVLPTSRQRAAFRDRLLHTLQSRPAPTFNVELFNFYSLTRRVLNLIGEPVRSLTPAARQHLLRQLAAHTPLDTLTEGSTQPGFAVAIGKLIGELKSDRVIPETFDAAARTHGTGKDSDIARLYAAYQETLRRNALVDTEGEAWLALARLREVDWNPHLELFVADGFDNFTPVQADLLRAIAARAGRSVVTLSHVAGREDGIGRRFEAAAMAIEPVEVRPLASSAPRIELIRHIVQHGFALDGQPHRTTPDAARSVLLIEAHSVSSEARAVMRHVKRLLVEHRAPPDDVLIALRDWDRYAEPLAAAASEYGVPIALQSGTALVRHPLLALIRTVLTLPQQEFRFNTVIDVLRSPYVALAGLEPQLISKLEAVGRALTVVRGRNAWFDALDAAVDLTGKDGEPLLTSDERDLLSDALLTLFGAVTPDPAPTTVWNQVRRFEDLLGPDPTLLDREPESGNSLGITAMAREGSTSERDTDALRAVKGILREMLLTEDLLDAVDIPGGSMVTWDEFVRDLLAAAEVTTIEVDRDRSGRVLIATTSECRGTPHNHVVIMGLSEGIFPAPVASDPIYLDSERTALTYDGSPLLRPVADRADDDSVFFELLALAKSTLTLSRPTARTNGSWPASVLWNGIHEILPEQIPDACRITVRSGESAHPQDAASPHELIESLYVRFGDSAAETLRRVSAVETAHVRRASGAELARREFARARTADPTNPYADHIGDLRLFAASKPLSLQWDTHWWSASQLESLCTSAYRVFAAKQLGFRELEDPEEGVDATVEGTLIHQILREVYSEFNGPPSPIVPEGLDGALRLLDAAADTAFAEVTRLGVLPGAAWSQQQIVIRAYLRQFVTTDFNGDGPIAQQAAGALRWTAATEFSLQKDDSAVLVTFEGDDGPVDIHLIGMIDRIDCIQRPDRLDLVIVDYKRSQNKIPRTRIENGQVSQVHVYAAALRAILEDSARPERSRFGRAARGFPLDVADAMYVSVRSGARLDTTKDVDPTVAYRAIANAVASVRSGVFIPEPPMLASGKCDEYCVFAILCRLCEMYAQST